MDNVEEMGKPRDVPTSGLMSREVNLLNWRQTNRPLQVRPIRTSQVGSQESRRGLTGGCG